MAEKGGLNVDERAVGKRREYLEERASACKERGLELAAQGRGDEAAFEKVRANVYDIFRTVLEAALRIGDGDDGAARRFFLMKAEQIPSSWKAARERAALHDDEERLMVEGLKLDTAREIRARFDELWEAEA